MRFHEPSRTIRVEAVSLPAHEEPAEATDAPPEPEVRRRDPEPEPARRS